MERDTRTSGRPWWFVEIPGAGDQHKATVSLYIVDEVKREVRCSTVTTLDRPIV